MQKILRSFICLNLFLLNVTLVAQHNLMHFIPSNTATHTAKQSGDWFDTDTWLEGTIPSDAAIVHIPANLTVSYEGTSSAHIFAIRVDGTFNCTQNNMTDTTTLTFDTFIGTMNSLIQFQADNSSDGAILVNIKPFNIEAHKSGTSGYSQIWNTNAQNHFSDQAVHYQTTYDIGTDSRFKTYANSQNGNTTVKVISKTSINDLAGVLGRTEWDPTQLSIGLVTMGELEIIGQEKSVMAKLNSDGIKGTKTLELESIPDGWEIGDTILITLGGNKDAVSNGNELREIANISGNTITTNKNLKKNHIGRSADDLHCFVGNLNRNIIFQSTKKDSTHRAHLMAMHNDENVQIKNASFIDMGRTDKSKLTDDRIWSHWVEPVVGNTYVSALGQECSQLTTPPAADISNHRGRYSIHLHQLGATYGSKMAEVTGNVIWGNPGWGITHHGSNANVSDNVIYQVTGSALVSEAGNETGFWDNNLIVAVDKGHTHDVYQSSLFYDDYLFSGQGMGMKGRGVVCRGNVIADANMGVGIVNFNAAINSTARMDSEALAKLRPGFKFDQFPLSQNEYAIEGDGILPLEVALILENTTIIDCNFGLSSIERDMGVNHESRSIFHEFKVWGASTGVRITYQNDYSFRNLFVSGRNDDAIGLYMWKHAHNHSFEGIKLVDLKEGITASKLVENSDYTTQKTRNNGFTPWLFIDLETENVTDLYGIHLDDESSPTSYTEHPDNPVHLTKEQLSMTRPVTFTLNDQADLEIDLAASPPDLRFSVDGVITDRIGAYEFGIEQASSMQNLRFDYPQRTYQFASEAKLEEYLVANGVYEDPEDQSLYFIIHEYVPDRISYEYKSFPVRIKLLNHPGTGIYAAPQTENPMDLAPKNELISRFATATQSSTSNTEFFNGTKINVPASRAIDGNSNGRINANFYQYGLDSLGSSAITQTELEPWWEMDLGAVKILEYIDLWNTVEMNEGSLETPSPHFKDFYVLINEYPFGDIDLATARDSADFEYYKGGVATRLHSVNAMNIKGRYIRIQAVGTTKIGLAEVDIIGRSITPDNDCNGDAAGLAYLDECEQCVGGNTGNSPCALDANYEWGGTATTQNLVNSVLPVELIQFTGQLIEDKTRLYWASASEVKVAGYEIWRSSNGQDWDFLDYRLANNQPSEYYNWDNNPFLGTTYYRLKMIDLDGQFEFSNIISVSRDQTNTIKLYPNPASNVLGIEMGLAEDALVELSIHNALGKLVQQSLPFQFEKGTAIVRLDISSLTSGTYYLLSKNGNTIRTQPFVVVKL